MFEFLKNSHSPAIFFIIFLLAISGCKPDENGKREQELLLNLLENERAHFKEVTERDYNIIAQSYHMHEGKVMLWLERANKLKDKTEALQNHLKSTLDVAQNRKENNPAETKSVINNYLNFIIDSLAGNYHTDHLKQEIQHAGIRLNALNTKLEREMAINHVLLLANKTMNLLASAIYSSHGNYNEYALGVINSDLHSLHNYGKPKEPGLQVIDFSLAKVKYFPIDGIRLENLIYNKKQIIYKQKQILTHQLEIQTEVRQKQKATIKLQAKDPGNYGGSGHIFTVKEKDTTFYPFFFYFEVFERKATKKNEK